MRILGILLLHLVVAAKFSWGDGLLCYSCQDLYSNEKCFNVTRCPTEEKCYGRADGLLSSEVKHTTGCTKEQNPLKTNVIGAYSFCSKACEKDLCNLDECTRDSQQNRTRGPRCLTCDLVKSPDECRNIVECSLGEMCFVSKIETFQQMRYRLGCIGKQHCSGSFSLASLVGRRSSSECNFCCTTDHCNLHACQGNGDVLTLDSMSPGVNCTDLDPSLCLSIGRLNSDACIDSNIVRTCPKSCVTCDHVGWSTWQPWGPCSTTEKCDTGIRSRNRTCHNRLIITKDQTCVGESMETSNCCKNTTAVAALTDRFSFNNCRSSGAFRFSNVSLTPEPIKLPGTFNISYNLQILKPINNEHFQLNITTSKRVLFGDVILPCALERYGVPPCTLPACDIFDFTNFIPLSNVTSTCKIRPYTCPLAVGNFHIPPTPIAIGGTQTPFSSLLNQGHYKILAELTDMRTHEIDGCFTFHVFLSQKCSGFSCLIG